MRRLLLALSALTALTSPAQALTKYICLDDPSKTTWLVPADFGTPNTIEAIGGGGGGGFPKNPGNSRGWGSGGGGSQYASSINVTLTPNTTVAISVGAGGLPGNVSTGVGGDGGQTWLCSTSSCPAGWNDSNAVIGLLPANGGTLGAGDNAGQCSTHANFNHSCINGGNGALQGARGGGGAGFPGITSSSGDAGSGYYNNLIGAFGGGAGGSAGQQPASNGGSAGISNPNAGLPGTPSTGGGQGGSGGGPGGVGTFGQHGGDGTLWSALAMGCLGPGGGAGAPEANNVGTDPLSPSGSPDGGNYGGGAAPGDLNNSQQSGTGGRGVLFITYTSTFTAHPTPEAFIY